MLIESDANMAREDKAGSAMAMELIFGESPIGEFANELVRN